MKILVLLAVYTLSFVNAMSPELKAAFIQQLTAIGQSCQEQEKADAGYLELLSEQKIPDSHEGMCLLFCVYKQLSLMKEDGSFNNEGVTNNLAILKDDDQELYDKMLKLYNICSTEVTPDNDSCVTSKNFFKCGVEHAPKIGLNFDLLRN